MDTGKVLRSRKTRAVVKQAHSLPRFSYRSVTYTFLDCQNTLLEELKCPICLELVFDPVQTSCGHLFCGRCITRTETCPVDRANFTTTPDNFNNRRLGNFKVKCPNSEKGCDWVGELREAEDHISEICPHQTTVKCRNGCGTEIEREHRKTHEATECIHRIIKCPRCPYRGTCSTVTTVHPMVCESVRLDCVAGCKRTLTRRAMEDHLAKICSEELVECPHKMAGCTSVVKRKDLKQHTSDKDYHLQVLVGSSTAAIQGSCRIIQRCFNPASDKNSHQDLMQSCTSAIQQFCAIIQHGTSPTSGEDHHIQALTEPYTVAKRQLYEAIQLSRDGLRMPLAFCPWLQNKPSCYPLPPWVFRLEGFQEKKETSYRWFSDPVYSHFGGYKMCLSVDAYGGNNANGTFVGVYISLMRGDNDDNLKWPFNGTIKVSLLNQLEDGQHYTKQIWSPDIHIPEVFSGRVTGMERANSGWGQSPFIFHQELNYHGNQNCQYLKYNIVFLRVDCIEPKLD